MSRNKFIEIINSIHSVLRNNTYQLSNLNPLLLSDRDNSKVVLKCSCENTGIKTLVKLNTWNKMKPINCKKGFFVYCIVCSRRMS